MSKPKSDFLIDGILGHRMGAFKGLDDIPEEADLVNVKYVPLNSFLPRVKLIKGIPRDAIIRFSMGEMNFTIITENSKGEAPFLKKIMGDKLASINELREKLSEKDFESRTAQYKAKESKESLDKMKQRERDRNRQSSGYAPFRTSYFGRPQQSSPRTEIQELEDL